VAWTRPLLFRRRRRRRRRRITIEIQVVLEEGGLGPAQSDGLVPGQAKLANFWRHVKDPLLAFAVPKPSARDGRYQNPRLERYHYRGDRLINS